MEESNQKREGEYNKLSISAIIFAIFFAPVGLILGIIALSQIKKTNEKGRGLAIVSIVWGAIILFFAILLLVVQFAWIGIRNTNIF